ncbi:hypothetical protein MSG28_004089 [Choristoneura fumiferana]|uniref:Uncharacterized protein n=1 Tax=Choristoneura fumiferana TaxID=7141 RepID=A0ACC0KHG4_CHOFU|nr:hypothetical protein MSG28_004089 [Choristoneura fumiferana]
MRWRPRAAPTRAKERANISFFIFIMFFAVFGVIILTELLLLERPPVNSARSRYSDALQGWEGRTETGADGVDPPPPAHSALDAVWQPVAGTRTGRKTGQGVEVASKRPVAPAICSEAAERRGSGDDGSDSAGKRKGWNETPCFTACLQHPSKPRFSVGPAKQS